MKILVPAAVLLMGGAAFLLRGEDVAPPTRTALPRPARETMPAATAEAAAPAAPALPVPAAVRAPDRPRPVSPVAIRLKGELSLNEEQVRQVAGILEDRDAAVAAYEIEVRRRGWSRLDEFERRIGDIRDLCYRRIGAILDAGQGRKFDAGRAELAAKDFLSIAIPEDDVVSLD